MNLDGCDPLRLSTSRFIVQLINMTSNTSVDPNVEIPLLEIREDHVLLLGLPVHTCSIGHNVVVQVAWIEHGMQSAEDIFRGTGKVRTIEHSGKYFPTEVKLVQFEDLEWQKMLEKQANRQEALNQFLTMAKG